jgi:DNA-binding LacI/PurR family transcriptional regulator
MKTKAVSSVPTNPSALVQTILDDLRKQVNVLAEGERLPTVRQLMKKFGVSQLAVQQALTHLKTEGLVFAHVGRGTFVAQRTARPDQDYTTIIVIRYDYPSRRGESITRALNDKLTSSSFRMLTLTCTEHLHAAEVLRDAPVAGGYILQPLSPNVPVRLLDFLRRRSPAVVVEGYPMESADVDAVATDELATVEMAVRHLTDLGHRHIVLATGEPPMISRHQFRYFPTVARWAGLPPEASTRLQADTKLGEGATEHMRSCLSQYLADHRPLPFTAMIVGSHASAVGAIQALAKAGYAVPKDVSVVVLDNPDLVSPNEMQFTMIGRTSQRIANDLVQRFQWRLKNPTEPYGTAYETPELVIRDTTHRIEHTA